METCVLIPKELSLVMISNQEKRKRSRNLFDLDVTLLCNQQLIPGTTFNPDEGQMRLDNLECFTQLSKKNIRYRFGCEEDIVDVEGRKVRHCNWIRFVQSTNRKALANMSASIIQGRPVYKVIRNIYPNEELCVYFKDYHKYEDEELKENIPQGIKTAPSSTPFKKRKSIRKCISIFDNTPVRRPFSDFMSPEKKRDVPCFASPISDHNNGSGVLSHTSPGSTGSDASPGSVTSKNTSPLSSIAAESPERRTEISSSDDHMTPPHDYCLPEHQLSPWGKSRDESMDSVESDGKLVIATVTVDTPDTVVKTIEHSIPITPVSTAVTFQPYKSILSIPEQRPNVPSNLPSPMPLYYTEGQGSMSPPGVVRRREKTWLPCDVCGKKFDRPSLLKRHMRTHTGEKPHACDVCGKAFSTSSSLNTHRRIHSGEKPHQCQVCGKCFTASSNLYYHRMTHKKEKPHKCTLCSKSFPTPGDLRSHMYVHNGSWPFKCDVCNRGFSKQTNLKNHMLLHSGDKPHVCPHCGKKFGLQCNLKTHIKTHEEEGSSTQGQECIRCSSALPENNPTGNMCHSCIISPRDIHSHSNQAGKSMNRPSPMSMYSSPAFTSPPSGDKLFHPHVMSYGMSPMLTGQNKADHRSNIMKTVEDGALYRQYGVSSGVHHPTPVHFRNVLPGFLPPPPSWPMQQ